MCSYIVVLQVYDCTNAPGPWGYKKFFMLSSTEHEISNAYRQMKKFLALRFSDVVFMMLINVKMLAFNIYEQDKFCAQFCLFVWYDSLHPINNLSVM